MLICAIDLLNKTDPASQQLLHSFKTYIESPAFNPTVEITHSHLSTFLFNTTIMNQLGVKVILQPPASSLQPPVPSLQTSAFPEIEPRRRERFSADINNLISGDPNRYWLAGRQYGGEYPFTIEFSVENTVEVQGLCIMPRQNHRDREGAPKDYKIQTSIDGNDWITQKEGELSSSFDVQYLYFDQPATLTKLRLTLLNGFGADDVHYWYTDREIGHTHARGPFHDKCASLAQVAFIIQRDAPDAPSTVRRDAPGAPSIIYAESKTASEEIY
jgi:hypothetical protein